MSFFSHIQKSFKIFGFMFLLLISTSLFVFPSRARAQWPVFDVPVGAGTWSTSIFQGGQFAKEFVGDSLANMVGKMILQRLTAQTVNWINSGFKGNPAFVTDPEQFFLNVGDTMASRFLSNGPLNNLCGPFKAQVRLALVKNYLQETSNESFTCTLDKLEANYDSFIQNFENGGWDSWFIVTQNTQNNPYGAYMMARNRLSLEVSAGTALKQKELDQGNGFLSFKRCAERGGTVNPMSNAEIYGSGVTQGTRRFVCDGGTKLGLKPEETDPNMAGCPKGKARYVVVNSDGTELDVDGVDNGNNTCSREETVTPGSVINDQLTKALGSTWGSLEASDEINEIVAALMQQLTSKIVGGISSGLRGLSDKGSATNATANNSRSFLEQIVDSAATSSQEYNDEFKKGQEALVPSDLGGTGPATPPIPPPQPTPMPTNIPVVDVRIIPNDPANPSGSNDTP